MTGQDVRAGRAYVELGTKDSALIRGLREGLKRVRDFADQAASVGRKAALFGFGLVGGLGAAAATFASTGVELSKLQKQTGLNALSLAGLSKAAEDNEVEFSQLAKSVTFLQRLIGRGGNAVAKAFESIGVSMADVEGKPLADVLGLIADRLPQIENEAQRTAAAIALFGRSGQELLPVFANGSKGLNEAAQAAQRFGVAMSDADLQRAGDLDDAFDSLGASLTGLRNAIGSAVAGALIPLIDTVVEVVSATRRWIEQNPQVVQTVMNVSLAVGALGATVAALAVSVWALTSPIILVVGLLAGLAAASLATLDALGVTATGFGEVFNSVRINGQGLATWWGKFTLWLSDQWSGASTSIVVAWKWLAASAANLGDRIYSALIWVPRAILEAYSWLARQINSLLGTELGSDANRWIEQMDAKQRELRQNVDDRNAAWDADAFQRVSRDAFNQRRAAAQLDELNRRDPNDGTTGVRFDGARLTNGLDRIGENIGDAVMSTLEGLRGSADQFMQQATEQVEPFASTAAGGGAAQALESAKRAGDVDALTTFRGDFASRLGVSSTVQERNLRAAEMTARNTQQIVDELRANGAAGAFGA